MTLSHSLLKVMAKNGTWARFQEDWERQCARHGDELEQYAVGSFPVLRDMAREDRSDVGVFALLNASSGEFDAVAQVNSAYLPGYDGKVLRVRHLLLSPEYDLGDYPIEQYLQLLARMFAHTVQLAYQAMPSRHVKFHLRSPADRSFFSAAQEPLGGTGQFESVDMKGAWLYLTIKQTVPGPV